MVHVDVDDIEEYKKYVAANALPFSKYGARFLARGGKFQDPEGKARTRNVVIEFPSYEAAVNCWHSPEYQTALAIRKPVSIADLVIVEGWDGPQSGKQIGILSAADAEGRCTERPAVIVG